MLAHDNIKMVARHDLNPHVLQLCFSLTACVSVMKLKEYVILKHYTSQTELISRIIMAVYKLNKHI